MQVLTNMSTDQMVIILPSALVAMYLIISLQKYLSGRRSRYPGLLIPVACFAAATVLAIRPLIVSAPGQYDGLGLFCLRMWLTFNIPTIVFMFPYFSQRRKLKAARLQQEAACRSDESVSAAGSSGVAAGSGGAAAGASGIGTGSGEVAAGASGVIPGSGEAVTEEAVCGDPY